MWPAILAFLRALPKLLDLLSKLGEEARKARESRRRSEADRKLAKDLDAIRKAKENAGKQ
jgi:hypothetical protein